MFEIKKPVNLSYNAIAGGEMKELEMVKEALNKGEFFDKDSKEILNSAEDLESIIITVEREKKLHPPKERK